MNNGEDIICADKERKAMKYLLLGALLLSGCDSSRDYHYWAEKEYDKAVAKCKANAGLQKAWTNSYGPDLRVSVICRNGLQGTAE